VFSVFRREEDCHLWTGSSLIPHAPRGSRSLVPRWLGSFAKNPRKTPRRRRRRSSLAPLLLMIPRGSPSPGPCPSQPRARTLRRSALCARLRPLLRSHDVVRPMPPHPRAMNSRAEGDTRAIMGMQPGRKSRTLVICCLPNSLWLLSVIPLEVIRTPLTGVPSVLHNQLVPTTTARSSTPPRSSLMDRAQNRTAADPFPALLSTPIPFPALLSITKTVIVS